MSTPRELLRIRNDLGQKVAERQLDRQDAVADLRAAAKDYPELLGSLADDWCETQIDQSAKRYIDKRNKTMDAAIARKLAELGLERPTLDGTVPPISEDDPSYSSTLLDYGVYLSTNLSSAWRLVGSFEGREEAHEMLMEAVGGNVSLTREQAVDVLKRMPEGERHNLRAAVRKRLAAERRAFLRQRYGTDGHAVAEE